MPQTELRREREERHCVSGTLLWVMAEDDDGGDGGGDSP